MVQRRVAEVQEEFKSAMDNLRSERRSIRKLGSSVTTKHLNSYIKNYSKVRALAKRFGAYRDQKAASADKYNEIHNKVKHQLVKEKSSTVCLVFLTSHKFSHLKGSGTSLSRISRLTGTAFLARLVRVLHFIDRS